MNDPDLNRLNNSSITKTHEEILEMLEEIKEFEKKYGELGYEGSVIGEDLTELEYVTFEEIEPELPIFNEIEPELLIFKEIEKVKPKRIKKIKFKINFDKFRKKGKIEKIDRPLKPTTFRLRINKEGKLENIDIKKPQPRKKINIRFRKKDKGEAKSTEEKSKFEKLKSGLFKIKRLIPIGKKEEEPQTEETEKSEEK
ncbi:MAG: hypothetical protein JSU91_06215 [Thermoplasmatales archaeon]|nr:MAG: hypothetical protein JSU91_06215 [Thermoplasmatales archaeon]